MDRSHIKETKVSLAQFYAKEKQDYERAKKIIANENTYKPVFYLRDIHQEEEPSVEELNLFLTDISHDLDIIHREFVHSAADLQGLIISSKMRLDSIQRDIHIEEERLKDLNMLCSEGSEFNIVYALTDKDFKGNFSHEDDGVFFAEVRNTSPVVCEVISVKGNGYEGNTYVYESDIFTEERMDTSNRNAILDHSLTTVYEYSRINADKNEPIVFSHVNFDNIEAQCSIVIRSEANINRIKVISDMLGLIVTEIAISEDGNIFRPVMNESLEINNYDMKYRSSNYIYGSGIICFPSTKFVKITLRSSGPTDDKIAFRYYDAKV